MLVASVVLMPSMPDAALAQSASIVKAVNHGPVASGPQSFGVYQGDVYFSSGERLLRMDGESYAVAEIALPGLNTGRDLDAEFITFDGALMFHASRTYSGSPSGGRYLHRLVRDNNGDSLTMIDIPEEPEELYPWATQFRGYADNTKGLAIYRGQLYFFGSQLMAVPSGSGPALYRLSSANATPQQVRWNTERRPAYAYSVRATSAGLALEFAWAGAPRLGFPNVTAYAIIRDPLLADRNNPNAQSETFPTGRVSGHPAESAVFDGHVFFASTNYDVVREPGDTIGPFPDPLDDIPFFPPRPYQIELGRMNASTGEQVYFDLKPTASDEVTGLNPVSSSSFPTNFVVSGNVLLFSARSREGVVLLHSLTSGEGTPAPTVVGPTSEATPLASINGYTWFAADKGNGLDLHRYETSGGSAQSMNLGESIASTAGSFTVFGDATVFTARDDNNEWATYIVRDPETPENPEPTETTDDGETEATRKQNIYISCTVANNTQTTINNVNVKVFERRNAGRPPLNNVCKRPSLGPNETMQCGFSTTVKLNARKYVCRARAPDVRNKRLKAWVTGHR